MGSNMVERLLEKGHEIVVYDPKEEALSRAKEAGAIVAKGIVEMKELITAPRLIWVMVPHNIVDNVLGELEEVLEKGDVVVDGGNSPYTQSMERAKKFKNREIHFLDAGVSGGPNGARNGACVMVGGEEEVYKKNEKLFKDISARDAYAYMGKSGAGHFVKMVHNGIEYGMMQAIAEGFDVLKCSGFGLNLKDVAHIYNQQSVITSRLVGWMEKGFEKHGNDLEGITGSAVGTGEALWTLEAAQKYGVQAQVIQDAVNARTASQKKPSFQGQIISVLRNQFGGHEAKEKE